MHAQKLSQKPHLGPKAGRRRSIRKKRSATHCSYRRKPRIKVRRSSGAFLYLYNQFGQLIVELDETGTTVREYIYLNGEPLAQIYNGNIYYYHNNHIGTPQAITDQSQATLWKADYTPFGQASITIETITNNLRLPGQYWDVETGLHDNGWRTYWSGGGRYLQSDPIGLRGGLNTYLYANANPTRFIDPLGLASFFSAEGHFILGAGVSRVSCCNENGDKLTMRFVKVCGGYTIGASAIGGKVWGLDNENCSPENYSGWFLELSGGVGPISGGLDIGFNTAEDLGLPDGLSGVNEAGIGGGIGLPLGVSWCYYTFLGVDEEPCACDKDD